MMIKCATLAFFFVLALKSQASSLRRGHYRGSTCPDAESIVRAAVEKKHSQTIAAAPATLRLFFHDCFVTGCDASVMVFSWNGTAEKDNPDNLSLAGDGFDTVTKAKEALQSIPRCRNKVSCADILAMAARDAVSLTGGPYYEVELGRLDGKISSKASVTHRLPNPDFRMKRLKSMFASYALSLTDLVALSGAHTIGFSHCNRVSKRIYSFKGKSGVDPTLDPQYADELRQRCPPSVDPRVVIDMDPNTPQQFDNSYYRNLQRGKGLFTSDQVLFRDRKARPLVDLFASNATAFEDAFVAAMTRLGRIGVKSGNQGEIRRDCAAIN